jgi:O-antigen biosynthesis protein WbqV
MANYQYKTTVVTGGAGSIGSAVVEHLLKFTSSQVWIIDNDESRIHSLVTSYPAEVQSRLNFYVSDIRDQVGLAINLKAIQPDMIIHAAALKHVPILERQPRDGFYTNVIGTQNILEYLRLNTSTGLIFVSSDKAALPVSILGKTKLIGEMLVGSQISHDIENNNDRLVSIVRFGNVFLSRGSVIETFISQIELGQNLTVTDPDMTRYFMDIDHAANLIFYVIEHELKGISIFKMGQPIKIIEVAKRLQGLLSAINSDITIIGKKDGEKLHEELFSAIELKRLNDLGPVLNSDHLAFYKNMKNVEIPQNHEEARLFIDALLNSESIFIK